MRGAKKPPMASPCFEHTDWGMISPKIVIINVDIIKDVKPSVTSLNNKLKAELTITFAVIKVTKI